MFLYTTIGLLIALLYVINKCSSRKIELAILEKNRMELSNKIAWLEAELDRSEIERKALSARLAAEPSPDSN